MSKTDKFVKRTKIVKYVCLPPQLLEKVEKTRNKYGLNISEFIRFCVFSFFFNAEKGKDDPDEQIIEKEIHRGLYKTPQREIKIGGVG